MRLLYCLIITVFLSLSIYAQDVAKTDAPKPAKTETLPPSVELTADQTKTVKDAETKFRLASALVENLQLKIESARRDLEKLQSDAKQAQTALGESLSDTSKIPLAKMDQYDIGETKDGRITFTLKKK